MIKFDGTRLYVEKVRIQGNNSLESCINPRREKDNKVFVKILVFISENLTIAAQNSALKLDLCGELKQKYQKGLRGCSSTKVQIEK